MPKAPRQVGGRGAETAKRHARCPHRVGAFAPFGSSTARELLVKTLVTMGVCALLGGTFLAAAPAPSPVPFQGTPDRQMTGTVTELWVHAKGSLTFRVHGTDDKGKVNTLWFKSPSDKDINTLAENLALSLLRQALQDGTDLLVEAKESSGDDGSTAAKAFSFLRIGIRPRPAGSAPR
jgi:hypothetical protein